MQDSDREQFVKLMDSLCAAFQTPPTEPLFEAYWLGLKDLPFARVAKGFTRAFTECKFIPKPVELRELAGENNAEADANAAWPEVLALARSSSGNHSDPRAAEAICIMGGGRYFGQLTEQELVWAKKDFVARYCEVADREKRGDQTHLQEPQNAKVKELATNVASAMSMQEVSR